MNDSAGGSGSTPSPEELAEFEGRLEAARAAAERVNGAKIELDRFVDGRRVVWAPQPGSQEAFLACPLFEVLYHGTRGGGKTDGLLMDFAQHVGQGFGSAWRGILFRQTYPQLADVVAKSERWFRQIFPSARFNRGRMAWEFDTGEVILFRHMRAPETYWDYHGHEYPWIGYEELTNWPDDRCYTIMFSCCRSSHPGVPRRIRSTTNPYGVGHNWVKQRFALEGRWWETIVQLEPRSHDGDVMPARAAIHSHLDENRALLRADPRYKQTIAAAADNQAMAEAWLHGSWAFVAGGMFSDVWSQTHNNLPRFAIPATWRIDRSFDWGSTKPFSVGWWAQSDGSDLRLSDGRTIATVRGDLFRVREWYGWTGRANEGRRLLAIDVSKGIVERELSWGWRRPPPLPGQLEWNRVSQGPADSSIFKVENGNCVATDMQQPVRIDGIVHRGVNWAPSDKSPGSRKNGWELMRKMIRSAQPPVGKDGKVLPREKPGLFVVGEECPQFLRTVLSLPRDEKDLDDVDTDAEDHVADEVRYRVRYVGQMAGSGTTTGIW